MKKIVLSIIMISVLALLLVTTSIAQPSEISVYYRSDKIDFEVNPRIIDGSTMVPLREIFETLGALVEWDDSTKTVTATRYDTTIELTIGEYFLIKNGERVSLDVPGQVVEARTFVPVRAIAEAFGVNVFWRDAVKAVTIHGDYDIVYSKLYDPNGILTKVEAHLVDEYISVGWARTLEELGKVTMYAADGRTKEVYPGKVEAEKAVGWYTEPFVTVYDINGNTRVIKKSVVADYEKVGWYSDKSKIVVTMYAPDGRTKQVFKGKVEAEKAVGWSVEPYVLMYKKDGSTKYVLESNVNKETKNGWSTEKPKIYPKKVYTTANITLKVGEALKLPVSFDTEKVTETSVTWSSSNNSVVTVNQEGVVKAVGVGTAGIGVKCENGVYTECKVTVLNASKTYTKNHSGLVEYVLDNGEMNEDNCSLSRTVEFEGTMITTSLCYYFSDQMLAVFNIIDDNNVCMLVLSHSGSLAYTCTVQFSSSEGNESEIIARVTPGYYYSNSMTDGIKILSNEINGEESFLHLYNDNFREVAYRMISNSTSLAVNCADSFLLDGTGFSIESIYKLYIGK